MTRSHGQLASIYRPGFLTALLFLLLGSVAAAELNFSASVDRSTVGLGEQFQLVLTVSGEAGVPRPTLPDLTDFNNLGSTSSQSTSISFVNGRMTREQTTSFIYFLEPKRVGTFTIGPAKLEYKGTVYQTQTIQITVTKTSQVQPAPARPQSPFGFEPQPRGRGRARVHLGASADRTSVYVGEQITVTYTFYTQARVADLNLKDAPSFPGFWSEKLFDAKDLSWRDATLDGQRYSAATIKQVAIFPTQFGSLAIDKMTIAGQLVVPGFFFDETEPFEVSSEPIRITAKPLPEAGRPADFSGGVGEFKLEASLSKEKSEGGEPVVLEIVITGTGNIGIIGEPTVNAPPGVKLLTPESKVETRISGGRIGGTRRFRFPILPQADGRHVIPAVSVSFFSPQRGAYYTLTTEPLAFVASGAAARPVVTEGAAGMRVLGSDIRHIKTSLGPTPLAAGGWTWTFYPAGIVVLLAGIVLGRHQRRLEADRGYARRARSSRLVRKRLSEATRLLAQGNEREFYAALSRAVIGYVGDRLNIESFGMTGEQLRAELAKRGIASDKIEALLDLVSSCDAARFSPGEAQCSPKDTLEQARALLEAL